MSKQKRQKLSSHAEEHVLRKLGEDAYLAGMDQFEAMRVAYAFDTTKGFSVRQQLDRLCRFCSLHKWPLYVVRVCCDWPFQKKWTAFRKLLADCSSKANVVCQPLLNTFSGRDYALLINQFELLQPASVEVATTSSDQQVAESNPSASSSDLTDMLAVVEPIVFPAGAAKASAHAACGASLSAGIVLMNLAKADATAAILHAVRIACLASKGAFRSKNQSENHCERARERKLCPSGLG